MRDDFLAMAVAKALLARIGKVDTATRAAVAEAMEEEDRLAVFLPGSDGERFRVGTGGVAKAKVTVTVTDETALLAWVKAEHPDWIETIERVGATHRDRLIAGARAAGEAVDTTTGLPVPGVQVRVSRPTPYVRLAPGAEEEILRMVRERLGPALARVLELEAGTSEIDRDN
ncbi:hypothetical protein [Nocardiopsis synnemataformans]|uniref:hypothetical protein n=1 Tax=Nocardiopsis synnemataformans TaxID=61305 RepID=UPI003EC0F84E